MKRLGFRVLGLGSLLLLALAVAWSNAAAEPAAIPLDKGNVIVFLGDSITQDGITETGFQTLLAEQLRRRHADLGVKLHNAGISGDKVTDLTRRLDRDVLAHKPTIVVLHVGINDVWRGEDGTPIDRYENALRGLVERIGKAGARVVLCTPSAIGERKSGANRFDKELEKYATVVRKVASETDSTVCDLRRSFVACLNAKNPDDAADGILTRDGVHLNEAGNRLVAEQLAGLFKLGPLVIQAAESSPDKTNTSLDRKHPAGPRWFFKDGDRLYWNGSSHSQDEGWQCSVIEFYLRTRFPEWKVTSGRGGPTDVSAAAFAQIIDKVKPTAVFCEFGYYGGDDQVEGVVRAADKLAGLCQEKGVRLVMLPSVFRAAHIQRLPAEYQGLSREQIAELNARKQKDGTLAKLGQEVPVEIHETHWRMRGAPGCDRRVQAMQDWGDKDGILVPRTYQDQRDWLFKVWETNPKFPWGGGHPPVAGYVAVGYFLLERLEAPIPDSRLVLDARGKTPVVKEAVQCEGTVLAATETGLRFQRLDKVLPVIPPLPIERLPLEPCPVLKYSPYYLTVLGLAPGTYEVRVESTVLGTTTHQELASGVNLNAVYLRSGAKAPPKVPWARLWLHCRNKIIDKDIESPLSTAELPGKTAWQWELRRISTD